MGWVDVTVESSMYLLLLYKKALGNVLSKMMKVAIYKSYQLPILDIRYTNAIKSHIFKLYIGRFYEILAYYITTLIPLSKAK